MAPVKVASGIFRVPGTRGGDVYLSDIDGELALIDTGLPGNAAAVLAALRSLGRRPADLRYVILTHGHPDHTGSARAIRNATGAKVLLHEGDTCLPSGALRYVRCPGLPHMLALGPWRVPVDGVLREGDVVAGLRVLHTPGHTPGSITLAAEDGSSVFVGDLLTRRGDFVSRSVPFPGTDLGRYHESLARIGELKADMACLGHGGVIEEGADAALRGAAAWYAESPYWRRWLQRVPGPLRPGLDVGFRYR